MKTIKYFLCLLLPLLAVMSCKDEAIVENPSGETNLYKNIYIVNGGLSGGDRYQGVYKSESDSINHIITFDNVAAETDIQHLRFAAYMSLGSSFDQESYDFLEGQSNPAALSMESTIRVISGENATDYKVVLNLSEPMSKPMMSKIEVETSSGRTINGTVDLIEKMVYLNAPNEAQVTVKNITLIPARTLYTFTNASGGKLSKDDPGTIEIDFLGITDSYRIFFDEAPAAGINFKAPTVYDFSVTTGNMPPDFSAELVRSADFDGKYVLIVSRDPDPSPRLLNASDILARRAPATTALSTNGIDGGTFKVSAGRLSQGHVYISNLSTAMGDDMPLKLYYWDTPESNPELILEFNGEIDDEINLAGQRYGDNMSVNLDENGDGYIFFIQGGEPATCNIIRFAVTGFTAVDEKPERIASIGGLTYYPAYNEIFTQAGEPTGEYLLKGTYTTVLFLVDKDAKELYQVNMADLTDVERGTDAQIVNYNSGRYLIMTSGRRWAYWTPSTLLVYDISNGFNTLASLVELNNTQPDPVYTYEMDATLSGAPAASAAWAAVDGKLVLFTAAPHCGFALIEFPKNQK